MRRPPLVALCFAVLALAAACSSDPGVTASRSESLPGDTSADPAGPTFPEPDTTEPRTTSPTTEPPTSTPSEAGIAAIDWQPYADRIDIGHLEVPFDYTDPSKGTFDLFVARHNADPHKRIGSLLVNPGGPGFGGAEFALAAPNVYSADLVDNFDIIGWDPRGTGRSTPAIDCVDDYDHFYSDTDITPDDDAERQQIIDLAKEYQDDCTTKNAAILQYVGTNNSARDMDAIRRSLGEAKISYFGFSYGSELGATWATLFPDTVRAAVLDGAADPTGGFLQLDMNQDKGFETGVATFLAQCSARSDCVFNNGGNSEGAFDALMLSLDDTPITSVPGRPDITRDIALTAVAQAMYRQSYWPTLEQALADAQHGNGAGLLNLYDSFFNRNVDGTYDNSLEAFQTIYCMDRSDRLTVAEEDADAPERTANAPRMSPNTVGSYMCTFYPASTDPRIAITGAGAGPILVVGTTGDPVTPFAGAEAMAATLEQGVLLTVEGNSHTGYGINQCSIDEIDGYLIDLTVPAAGTTCS